MNTAHHFCVISIALLGAMAGCKARPSLIPNSDPALRKTNAEFAADAKQRHPYPADAPKGGEAVSRAQVGYDRNVLQFVNLSDQEWKGVNLWVNRKYVVHLPRVERGQLKTINFKMLYDDKGRSLPTSGTPIKTVEILRDGTLYDVPVRLAE